MVKTTAEIAGWLKVVPGTPYYRYICTSCAERYHTRPANGRCSAEYCEGYVEPKRIYPSDYVK